MIVHDTVQELKSYIKKLEPWRIETVKTFERWAHSLFSLQATQHFSIAQTFPSKNHETFSWPSERMYRQLVPGNLQEGEKM